MKETEDKSKIISIQSRLVFGHVGSNIAEMAISLHGLDIISLPTVLFSTHTGFTPVYGESISKKLFDDLITGIKAIDIIKDSFAIISGYIANTDIVKSSSDFISETRKQYPHMLYVCDPVMGDNGGLYVSENVAKSIISDLLPQSDIITPNQFEMEYICDTRIRTIADVTDNIRNNSILNRKVCIITGCYLDDTPQNSIETIIVKDGEYKRIVSPKVEIAMVGTGDFFAALLISQLACGKSLNEAVTFASNMVSQTLTYATRHRYQEMNSESIMATLGQEMLDTK